MSLEIDSSTLESKNINTRARVKRFVETTAPNISASDRKLRFVLAAAKLVTFSSPVPRRVFAFAQFILPSNWTGQTCDADVAGGRSQNLVLASTANR
jgi:hypothetical protein